MCSHYHCYNLLLLLLLSLLLLFFHNIDIAIENLFWVEKNLKRDVAKKLLNINNTQLFKSNMNLFN